MRRTTILWPREREGVSNANQPLRHREQHFGFPLKWPGDSNDSNYSNPSFHPRFKRDPTIRVKRNSYRTEDRPEMRAVQEWAVPAQFFSNSLRKQPILRAGEALAQWPAEPGQLWAACRLKGRVLIILREGVAGLLVLFKTHILPLGNCQLPHISLQSSAWSVLQVPEYWTPLKISMCPASSTRN